MIYHLFRTAIFGTAVLALFAGAAFGQGKVKEILLDPDGNTISNDEFRDYSLSDPQRKDPFTRTVLADGTVEIRLNRNSFEGKTAPQFTATTINGKTLDQALLKDKVLVLNFWFIGCPGCMEELPKLNELAAKYAENPNVVFIALALDSPASLRRFLEKERFNYLHVGDSIATISLFGVRSFPRNVVVGRDGKIVYWRSTVKAWKQFDRVIETELGK